MPENIEVKLIRSSIGSNKKQRATLRGLGLRKINDIVYMKNTSSVRGMVNKVVHLVEFKTGG